MTQKTKNLIADTGRTAGSGAVQALAMVVMFRLADAAIDAATDWIRSRRTE